MRASLDAMRASKSMTYGASPMGGDQLDFGRRGFGFIDPEYLVSRLSRAVVGCCDASSVPGEMFVLS